ncbi:YcxB family protein [Cellulosilyticum sp. I15G10I2]|uniref:YcxB family protein n=1 Tax=Cellulosilyticum sp. I15G10I2 TaxID=1892843 RepID=UPI00085C0250|nr:YcxB family protein [Cellulosilyticum sp. I15G10I2]
MKEAIDQQLLINVEFKVKDVLRYNMWVVFRGIANKVIMLLGVVLLGVYIYKMINRTVTLDIFITSHVLLLLVPVMIFLLIPWRTWKITLTQMQTPAFAFGVKYTFLLDKIILDLGTTQDEMPWDLFIEIVETKYDLRFFVDEVNAQLIPKHNLTKAQLEQFKRIASQATEMGVCKFKEK